MLGGGGFEVIDSGPTAGGGTFGDGWAVEFFILSPEPLDVSVRAICATVLPVTEIAASWDSVWDVESSRKLASHTVAK